MSKLLKLLDINFLGLVVCGVVVFSSSWFWQIWGVNILVGVLMVFWSFVFSFSLTSQPKNKMWFWIVGAYCVTVGVFSVIYFDTSVVSGEALEKVQLKERQGYNGSSLGYLLHSEGGLIFHKLTKNFFYQLDINQYFFRGHPRERSDAYEFDKFNFLLVVVFLVGLWKLIILGNWRFLGFLLLVIGISSVASPKNLMGVFSVFPLLVSVITFGAIFLVGAVVYRIKGR